MTHDAATCNACLADERGDYIPTRRERIAAAVLGGFVSREHPFDVTTHGANRYAVEAAIMYADALIAELDK